MEKDIIAQISTIYFDLDEQLIMQGCSDTLVHYCKNVEGARLDEYFEFLRPSSARCFQELTDTAGEMVLMHARDKNFAFRGQFVCSGKSQAKLMFVGAPWLAWVVENCPGMSLRMEDFPAFDVQLDQTMYITMAKQSLKELDELNGKLTQAKDRAEQANKSQSDFFALMSHEMRTPLNGLSTALELIEEVNLQGEDLRMLQIARNSSDSLKRVIDQVLNYSKLEAGGFSNDRIEFSLSNTLASVRDLISPRASKQDTFLIIENRGPDIIVADEAKLRQVLINLVGNAVKFTRLGEIRITASYGKEDGHLYIQVADTGEGIAEEMQPRIFESFWSFENKREDTSGTGLGLSICHRFVEIMGGKISFESHPGKGTTFFIDLPVEVVSESSEETLKTTGETEPYFSGKVLLVEDNPTNQYLGSLLLKRRGIEVDIASTGREALDKVETGTYQLVLMDISMPVMDGIEATEELRKTSSSEELPIVAMTAHADEEEHVRCIGAGMNAVITKPIDIGALDRVLAKYCEQKERSEASNKPKRTARRPRLIIDNEAKKLVNELGWEIFVQIGEMFSQEAREKLEDILLAYKEGNLRRLAKTAHSIRSTAATVGCLPLADYLKSLELTARDENQQELQELMEGFPEYVELSLSTLKGYMAKKN